MSEIDDIGASIIDICTRRGLTIAVAESLTGGLLVSRLIETPGASSVVAGGVVAYNTAVKHSVVGVDDELLAARGAVDPDVAAQMADRIRAVLAVNGHVADIGLATTGVAGPEPQDGKPVGLVYLGFAIGEEVRVAELHIDGSREEIRDRVVEECLERLAGALAGGDPSAADVAE